MRARIARSFVVLVLVSGSLAACSGSEAETGGGNPPSAAASIAAFPSPVEGGLPIPDPSAMLPVVGQETVVEAATASPEPEGDGSHIRDATATYEGTMSDARVSGTRTVTANLDQRADGSGSMWGTSVIRNDNGSWSGTWTGLISKGSEHRYFFEDFVGAGAYEGLTYHRNSLWAGDPTEAVPGDVLQTSGWLEKADGSAVQPSQVQTSGGQIPVSGFATFKSAGARAWVFRNTMTDPRVSGLMSSIPIGDPKREDGSTDYGGTFKLDGPEGTWVCSRAIGSRGADTGGEHTNYCEAKGTGAYEGLVYHSHWHFFEPFGPDTRIASTGWIEPAT